MLLLVKAVLHRLTPFRPGAFWQPTCPIRIHLQCRLLHVSSRVLELPETMKYLTKNSSMIPATLLVTKFPAHRVIPAAMTLWGIFTLLCYRAQSFSELAGYRFMVGLLEGKRKDVSLGVYVLIITCYRTVLLFYTLCLRLLVSN